MTFYDDLRREILIHLPIDASDPATRVARDEMPTETLLIYFLNWVNRLVHPHPRTVLKSADLLKNPFLQSHRLEIETLEEKIKSGKDVGPHLSKRIREGFSATKTPTKNLNKRGDLDLLLNDWDIHHLHLSNVIEESGFVARSELLLFVIFGESTAYFLDILKHGTWTNQRLAEIAIENWPHDGLFHQLNVLGVERDLSSDDRHKLRGAGLATMIQVDGRVYMSNSFGISTAGTSTKTSRQAQNLLRQLRSIEQNLTADPSFLRPYIEQGGKKYPEKPAFELNFVFAPTRYGFGIREKITDVVIGIG